MSIILKMKLSIAASLAFSVFIGSIYASQSDSKAKHTITCPEILPLNDTRGPCHIESPCRGNSPNTRTSWCCRNIHTDYELDWPDTGVTREYESVVGNHHHRPDGHDRATISVNGKIPGPPNFADWGDWVIVHVRNNLTAETNGVEAGVSIHWHGINQW
jgi:FtsP/CotA-like multicopper oxidase with cupredoxin domain